MQEPEFKNNMLEVAFRIAKDLREQAEKMWADAGMPEGNVRVSLYVHQIPVEAFAGTDAEVNDEFPEREYLSLAGRHWGEVDFALFSRDIQ